jgi:hypothetical protein
MALAVGDFNGDGRPDLAVGAPRDNEEHGYDQGSVTIFGGFASSVSGPNPTVFQRWTKDSPGVGGSPTQPTTDEPDDFGAAMAAGDFNRDGRADLVIGSPGSRVVFTSGGTQTTAEDAGAINVLPGSAGGLTATGSLFVTQDTAGMPGTPGTRDGLGHAVTAGDVTGDGRADLAVSSLGDQSVFLIKGTSTGLVLSGVLTWSQDSTGISGTTEAGDQWGSFVRLGYFSGFGHATLAVGAPGEDLGTVSNTGAVTVIPGAAGGLTATGSQFIYQDGPGVPGTDETDDEFGWL